MASQRLVVINTHVTGGLVEGWILPDRDRVGATTSIVAVALTLICALVFTNRWTIDASTTEALAVVLETGVAKPVTLARGNALGDSHALTRQARVER